MSGGAGVGSMLLACQSWPWCRLQILPLIKPSLGLDLIHYLHDEMSPTSFLENLFSWIGSDPPPAAATLPSSLKRAAPDFQAESFLLIAEMTQLGPPSSTKLFLKGATTEDSVCFW